MLIAAHLRNMWFDLLELDQLNMTINDHMMMVIIVIIRSVKFPAT